MANEFQHKDPGSILTQTEYITTDGTGHIFDSQAQGDILFASSTTVLARLGKDTNSTRVLTNTGTSNNPAWAQVVLTTGVTGTLPVANGGTGATTLTDKAVLISQDSGTDTLGSVALTTSGQVIIGGASGPAAATLTAGCNITITNGDGSISIAAASGASDISVRAYNNAAQALTNACDVLVVFQTENYDTDSMHGTNTCQCATDASSKLTAKTAGKYHISAGFEFATHATGFRGGYIQEGGDTTLAVVRQTSVCGTGKSELSISTDYDLGACEYVQLKVAQNSGGSLNLNDGSSLTWFAMHKIN